MKFSVFTVMCPDMTKEDVLVNLNKYGYDGVEWRYKETPDDVKEEKPSFWRNNLCTIDPQSTDEELRKLAKKTEEQNIETISVTPYLTCGDLQETERVLQVAQTMGARMVRLGVPGYDRKANYHTLFEKAVQYLSAAEELCQQYKIKGLIETHHQTIAPSASLAYRLVNQFDPEHIGVLYDPGNMVHEGFENYRMGLELLGPYLAHVHAKNASFKPLDRREDGIREWQVQWSVAQDGVVDWKQVLTDLKAVGYHGYIGMEDFSGDRSSEASLKENISIFKSLIDQL
ncbi:sugar phosphate isomerase/epimerase family protein [Halalkalibacter urbisdiaboli]|uniref:sugar phosphate isomerase/epimerase family protein n=1 Tax=Halalkalibacter urbisdiaboli TaxID=1960589 RepID=UPI000B444744|nr:sugar phosphate isomerase/epimerase [Halalkalibacter urbisdiaboli]